MLGPSSNATGPLHGVRVLDISRILSGPFCTMLLADLGAEVVKVEQPMTGDPARHLGPQVGGDAAYFMSVNRGKKSITLNIFSEEGQRLLCALVPHFDVLVENYVPGMMARLGLGYDRVKELNPRLVYASISGFGQDGTYAHRPALDIIVQAMGGMMSVTGEQGGPPLRPGASLGDSVAGMFVGMAIVSALFDRERSSHGQHIDISMLDCQVTMMENAFSRYFATGEVPGPLGSRHPAAAPFQAFRASDGYFVVAMLTDREDTWLRFCNAVGVPELGKDHRFLDNLSRMNNYDVLNAILQKTFLEKPVAFWLEALSGANLSCGPVNDIAAVASDPQVLHRGMVATIPHKRLGTWRVANTPFRLSHGASGPAGPSPDLGEHTEEVLGGLLRMSEDEISRLRKAGVL
ncbi:MAG: CoA transferase [Dehalococcoidia bacterium]|nr:CoA transferase [Dehalococcoidia bacterium]